MTTGRMVIDCDRPLFHPYQRNQWKTKNSMEQRPGNKNLKFLNSFLSKNCQILYEQQTYDPKNIRIYKNSGEKFV